jgi:hypothetical protein
MSEYCSQCNPFVSEYDIDLHILALKVEPGHSINFLCEGCDNRALYKDEDGKLYILRKEEKK